MEDNKEAFSSVDLVGQCLVDEERTSIFHKVIKNTVNENSTVLELGTGSGIMALAAANAGAKKVVAVELDPHIAYIAKNNFKENNYSEKISLIVEDATKFYLPEIKFNVVISEMLTTGMIDEHQVEAINNLHNKKMVDNSTVFIPQRQDTFVSLVNANFSFFGFNMPMILHLWKWHKWDSLRLKKLSNVSLLNSVDFNLVHDKNFSKFIEIKITETATINGVYFTSKSVFNDEVSLKDTEALNGPVLVPIEEKKVKFGDKINLKIEYVFGGGYSTVKIEVIN